jgi:hypothetical protein
MPFPDNLFGSSTLPSSPTSQSTQTTTPSIQPQFQPYISNYLNATQNLIANQQTPELLNQSYIGAAGLQLPGGFASGTALAEAGGRGSLSTVPFALDYGRQGAEYGAQGVRYGDTGAAMGTAASRAGDMYAQQATSPEAMAQYMSPYMKNVVDYQKNQAVRDYQIQAPQMAAQAAGAGAFGGNRLALQQSEANRGLQNRLAGIDATGQQTAFEQARQAQQFGSQLGLQGLQAGIQGQQVGLAGLGTAMQGSQVGLQGVSGAQQGYSGATQAGGTLGNIAAQQAQARIAQLQLQNQFGQQQQMFPYQQQQIAQQMMSNLPFTSTSSTTQGYQAPPNTTSQLAGLGTAGMGAYGLYRMFNAKGGVIKPYAEGGDVRSAGMAGMGSDMGMAEYIRNHPEEAAAISAGMGSAFGDSDTPQNMREMYQSGSPMGAGIAGLMPARDFSEMPMSGTIPMGQIPQPGGPMGAGMSSALSGSDTPQNMRQMYQPGGPMSAGIGPAFGGSNEDYVNSLYANMLGRKADQRGYQHNLDLLNSGKVSAQDLAGAFRTSAEGQRMPSRVPQPMGAGMGPAWNAPASSGLADIRLNQLLG